MLRRCGKDAGEADPDGRPTVGFPTSARAGRASTGFDGVGIRAIAIFGGGGNVPTPRASDGNRITGGRSSMSLDENVAQLTLAAHPAIDTRSSQMPTSPMSTAITRRNRSGDKPNSARSPSSVPITTATLATQIGGITPRNNPAARSI